MCLFAVIVAFVNAYSPITWNNINKNMNNTNMDDSTIDIIRNSAFDMNIGVQRKLKTIIILVKVF